MKHRVRMISGFLARRIGLLQRKETWHVWVLKTHQTGITAGIWCVTETWLSLSLTHGRVEKAIKVRQSVLGDVWLEEKCQLRTEETTAQIHSKGAWEVPKPQALRAGQWGDQHPGMPRWAPGNCLTRVNFLNASESSRRSNYVYCILLKTSVECVAPS